MKFDDKYGGLVKDFAEVINRNSLENGSNTPDYILARMLVEFLATYNDTIQLKEEWHKKIPKEEAKPREWTLLKAHNGEIVNASEGFEGFNFKGNLAGISERIKVREVTE